MPPRYFIRGPNQTTTFTDISEYFRLYELDVAMNAEEGSVATSQARAYDPDATLNIVGHRQFRVLEDSAVGSNQLIYAGYTAERKIWRGDVMRVGDDRVWDITLTDINTVITRRLIRGSDADRPAESDVARMQWVIASSEASLIDDSRYLSTSGPVQMDAVDYRGQRIEDVMNDCAQQSGKNYFIWYTADTDEFSIFYDFASSSVYSSPLRLTNVLADIDDVWTFAISLDTHLTRDPSRVYSGVLIEYDGGQVYETDTTTANTFALSGRDASMPSLNVKSSARATARANRYLADLDTEEDVITTTVVLPAAKVNFLMQGMRVQFKATHLSGYEDWTWGRVLMRSVAQLSEDFYGVTLDISISETSVATCDTEAPGLFQQTPVSYNVEGATFPASPASCVQVFVEEVRQTPAANDPELPVGFTMADWAYVIGATNNGAVAMSYRTTQTGDSDTIVSTNTGGDRAYIGLEFAGATGLTDTASISDQTSAATLTTPSVTPTPGSQCVLVGVFVRSGPGPAGGNSLPNIDIDAPATEVAWTGTIDTDDQGPTMVVGYQIIESASGSYTMSATSDNTGFAASEGTWGAVIGVFEGTGEGSGGGASVGTGGDDGGTTGGGIGGTIVSPGVGTLAAAISAASSGDTLTLRGGDYYIGSIISTGKALTIQNYFGETPNITWSAGVRNDGIYYTGSGTMTLSGLTFTATSTITHDANGSAQVELDGGSGLTLLNCTFIGNASYDDHQQLVYQRSGSNVFVQGCTFTANGSEGFGFHQYPAAGDPNCIVESSTFTGFAVSGGVTSDSTITVRNCTFNSNNIAVQLRNDADNSVITGNGGSNNTTELQLNGCTGVTDSGNTWT